MMPVAVTNAAFFGGEFSIIFSTGSLTGWQWSAAELPVLVEAVVRPYWGPYLFELTIMCHVAGNTLPAAGSGNPVAMQAQPAQ